MKHGIFKDNRKGYYEAWKDGVHIGSIGIGCQEHIIELWKERYSRYLKQ